MKLRIKRMLIENGLKQKELADVSDVAPSTLNKICNGKYDPSPTLKNRLRRGLNELSGQAYSIIEMFENEEK